ncbi:MAG: ATP-binding protein [Candidatus Thermoplasmatota archaeon]|nr:ATP-binding protein [Candidatus Thermoplasmatota archaeon]
MTDLIDRFNPWWFGETQFPGIPRETYLEELMRYRENNDVILVSGLRRTGKTTLMKQMIHRMIDEGTKPEHILFISMDNIGLKDRTILEIEEEYRKSSGMRNDERLYLFLDEVHFQEKFELQLKNLYDLGMTKIFASGSANLEILMKTPHLTGRYRIVEMRPLDFREFLIFNGHDIGEKNHQELVELAHQYALTGGIPEYVLTGDINSLNTMIQSVLFRDVFTRSRLRDNESLLNIFTMIVKNVSTPVSIRSISRVLNHSEETIRKVLELLEEVNLIRKVERYGNFKERKANPPKYYLSDTGIFNVIMDKVNMGAVVENLVFLKLRRYGSVHYHRSSGKEIDFILKKIAFEVKYVDDLPSDGSISIVWKGKKRVITRSYEGNLDTVKAIPLAGLLVFSGKEDIGIL